MSTIKSVINKIYNNSPLPAYNLNVHIFLKELRRIEKVQFFPRKILTQYQNQKFKQLITHAYNNVKFYHRWFKENNLSLSDFKDISDIKKLPILSKPIIRRKWKDFIALDNKHYSPAVNRTSGSTGTPFKFLIDKKAYLIELASIWRQWRIYDAKLRDRIAILRGTLAHDYGTANVSLWKYNYFAKSIAYNTFHMNGENCKKILLKNLEFRPRIFRVYPMALYVLALYMEKYDINFPELKFVHFSSESYTKIHRDFIKEQFTCPILDRYGQSEYILNAYECEPELGYHIEEENHILELLDANQEEVSQNETGKIVGTNLFNYSMPLIRYATDDLAVLAEPECLCGRHSQKFKLIEGRILDQIITEDRALISGISFYHYWKHRISDKIPEVSFVQIIQPKIDEIVVKLLIENEKKSSKHVEDAIVTELNNFIGNMDISFDYLEEQPFGQRWRFTISKIPLQKIEQLLRKDEESN